MHLQSYLTVVNLLTSFSNKVLGNFEYAVRTSRVVHVFFTLKITFE